MHAGPVADATDKVRRGADFLFGVLIAVSLEKAVEGFLRVAVPAWLGEPVSPHEPVALGHIAYWLALIRLLTFASLITNFYFGSIKFFDATYGDLAKVPPGFGNRFRIDVFSGLIHFALFYAWSLSISVPGTIAFRVWGVTGSRFLLMLLVVLSYDVVWLGVRWFWTIWSRPAPWNTRDIKAHLGILGWTWRNVAIVAGVIVVAHFEPARAVQTEVVGSLGAMALNLWEFVGIVS